MSNDLNNNNIPDEEADDYSVSEERSTKYYSEVDTEEDDDDNTEAKEIEAEDAEEAAAVDRLFEICQGDSSPFTSNELDQILERYPNAPKRVRVCHALDIFTDETTTETLVKYPLHVACRRNAPFLSFDHC